MFVLAGFLQHFMCFVVHVRPHGWSMSGIDRTSYLSLFNCRFLSDGCMNLPQVQYTMPASQCCAQSEHCISEEISHSSKYSVLPFDFSLNGLDSSILLKFSIDESQFGWFSKCWISFFLDFLAVGIFFLNSWVRYTLNSVINVTATNFLVLRSVIFFEMFVTRILEMWATNFLVLRALFALMVGVFSHFEIRMILASMLQIWREYDSR